MLWSVKHAEHQQSNLYYLVLADTINSSTQSCIIQTMNSSFQQSSRERLLFKIFNDPDLKSFKRIGNPIFYLIHLSVPNTRAFGCPCYSAIKRLWHCRLLSYYCKMAQWLKVFSFSKSANQFYLTISRHPVSSFYTLLLLIPYFLKWSI